MSKINPQPSRSLDLNEAQAKLNALQGALDNNIYDNQWDFLNPKGRVITIDFETLSSLNNIYPNWIEERRVNLISLTKLMWLSCAQTSSVNQYRAKLHGLALFWAAMMQHNIQQLTRENCSQVLTFLLTHQYFNGKATKLARIKSKANFSIQTSLVIWRNCLSELEVDFISKETTNDTIKKKLKYLIPSLTDEELTYRDWFQGGSTNKLTLDYGRYYVEHCMDFFERHIPLATALEDTFRAMPNIAASLELRERTVGPLLPRILQGYTPNQLNKLCNQSLSTIELIHQSVENHFKSVYRSVSFSNSILQESTLKNMIKTLELSPTQENEDRLRVITWEWLQRGDKENTQTLLTQCQPSISFSTFHQLLSTLKEQSGQEEYLIPSIKDYQHMGLRKPTSVWDSGNSYPRQLIDLVRKAGLTSVVALTGWRRSEFGFPASAIKSFKNVDKLDEHAFPLRYQVNWHVYKTHGKVQESREVTFSSIAIADRLQNLVGANANQPCLYGVTSAKKDAFESGLVVEKSVTGLWEHYVMHYKGFQMLEDWQYWKNIRKIEQHGRSLTLPQKQEKKRLLKIHSANEWDQLPIDGNLKEAWRRSREEWPKLKFFLETNYRKKKNWLTLYRQGTLREDWTELLDTHLPEEILDWLLSLSDEDCKSPTVVKSITSELLENVLYPTPHAFRHMWAEAVYRRFDGDAGWMIRSQFKHISSSMWLAYIRDKDNRLGHQRVKKQVVSSLVYNYLNNKGEGYAGQLHIWLRRLFRKTKVMTPEEQVQFADRLATIEIEDIKANPWGYCLLKRRTRRKAKCAEMGEPMRHNASPDLCLGCIHNLMQSENVDWILLHIYTHLEALKNPVVPSIFKASSYELVKNSTRHVRTLNPKHEALPELQEALDNYNAARAA